MSYVAKLPNNNGVVDFTDEEHGTWHILIERQLCAVQNRACHEYMEGLHKLNLSRQRIPQCSEINTVLQAETGWSVVPVAAMIPLTEFFRLLANRQFPAASFIRIREELDYLQEPDIFHEYFGHCPMLTNPVYADFVQWYGEAALQTNREVQSILGRLFWFTIEFGLMHTAEGMRIYGGGILSSYAETIYALEDKAPERKPFDLVSVLHHPYRYDVMQECYYYLRDFSELFALKSNRIIQLAENIAKGDFQHDDFIIC